MEDCFATEGSCYQEEMGMPTPDAVHMIYLQGQLTICIALAAPVQLSLVVNCYQRNDSKNC